MAQVAAEIGANKQQTNGIKSEPSPRLDQYESLVDKAYHSDVIERLDGVYTCSEAFFFYKKDRTKEAQVIAIMESLKCDNDPKVRLELCLQLRKTAPYCSKLTSEEIFYRTILENVIFRCIIDLLRDGSSEVRRSAKRVCLDFIKEDSTNGPVLKKMAMQQAIVMGLQSNSAVFRFEGVDLLDDLELNKEEVSQCLPLFKKLLIDGVLDKVDNFCSLIGWNVFKEELLELLMATCDSSDVSTRIKIPAILVQLAKIAPPEEQYGTIIPLYDDLLNDPSRIVRNSAYELLGLLIHATRKSRFQRGVTRGRSRLFHRGGNLSNLRRERTRSEETLIRHRRAARKVDGSLVQGTNVRMGESSTLEFPTTIMKAINMEDLSYETARIDVSSEDSNSSSSYSDAVMTSQSTSMDETSEPVLAPLATEDEIELQDPKPGSESSQVKGENQVIKLDPGIVIEDNVVTLENHKLMPDNIYTDLTPCEKSKKTLLGAEPNGEPQMTKLEKFMDKQLRGGSMGSNSSSSSSDSTPQDMFVRAQISFNFASTSSGKSSLINTSSSFEEEIARNQETVSPLLLKYFLGMLRISEEHMDPKMSESCARNFPAVLAALGPNYWSIIVPVFQKLVNDMDWKVRQKVASSLHELAKMMGPSMAEAELLATFESYFNDVDEVRAMIASHCAQFILALGPIQMRDQITKLASYSECENERDWRYKLNIVNQLEELLHSIPFSDVKRFIWPLILRYSVDPICQVRKQAYILFGKLMRSSISHKDEELTNSMKDFVFKLFYSSPSSKGRIAFAQICACLAQQVEYHWFAVNFGDLLLSLQSSSVKDIQIALQKSLDVIKEVHNNNMLSKQSLKSESQISSDKSSEETQRDMPTSSSL